MAPSDKRKACDERNTWQYIPNLVRAIRIHQPPMHKPPEWRNPDPGSDQQHRPIRHKLFRQRIRHQPSEHWHAHLCLPIVNHPPRTILKESRADAGTGPVTPVLGRLMHGDGNLDDATVLGARFMRVVGKRVETWHEIGEVAEEVWERWLGGGKGMEKL